MAKQHIIGVRVDKERLGQFERAAKAAKKKVSGWLRDLGIFAVERGVEESVPVPVVHSSPKPADSRSRSKGRVGKAHEKVPVPTRSGSLRAGSSPAPAKKQDTSEIIRRLREEKW